MLDGKPRDIWVPAPFGLNKRCRKVTLALMWISVLVGSQPHMGKTFSARLLALYAVGQPPEQANQREQGSPQVIQADSS